MAAPTADHTVRIAASQIGTVENPPGSNRVLYSIWYRLIGPWCAMFVSWVAYKAGATKIIPRTARVASAKKWYQDHGQWHTSNPRKGDQVIYKFSHTGLIEAVNADGTLTVIEGNTDKAGGRTGGKVMRQYRRTSIVDGYGRPKYAPAVKKVPTLSRYLRRGSTGLAVTNLQKFLNAKGYAVGAADGDFGPRTDRGVRAFQRAKRLTADGVVGRATASAIGWRWIG
jgi:hypothetical protein